MFKVIQTGPEVQGLNRGSIAEWGRITTEPELSARDVVLESQNASLSSGPESELSDTRIKRRTMDTLPLVDNAI
jgi:hypothetical protein